MVYSDEQLSKLHEHEKSILREVIRICEENDLSYFVDWGTLLGVVRHGGFIPWDDDIDICMPRESYQAFLKLAPEVLSSEFVLQHFSVDPKTPSYCAKIRKNGTKFVEACNVKIPVHQGIFIDIYPIDYLPDDPALRKKYRSRASFLKQLYIAKGIKEPSYSKSRAKKMLLTFIRTSMHILLIPISRKYLFNLLDNHLQKYNGGKHEMASCIGTMRGEHLISEIFPLKDAKFDEMTVKVPANEEAVLHHEYGDYSILPPPEQRFGHAPAILEL